MLYSTRYGFSLQHSSPLVPNPQSLQSFAVKSAWPTHCPHLDPDMTRLDDGESVRDDGVR